MKNYQSLEIISEEEQAQIDFCKNNHLPLFANKYCCGTHYHPHEMINIYNYISVEEAGSKLITSCPKCGKSFCD